MKLIYHLLALVSLAVVLVLSGLFGYLVLSGRLNADVANTIAAVLAGKEMVEVVHEETPTTQPAAEAPAMGLEQVEMRSAMLDRQLRVVDDRLTRLKDAELKLIRDREAFQDERGLFARQVELQQKANEDEGFRQALSMYTQIPPDQVKEDFMKLDLEIVVRYLMSMPKRNQAKILQEFATPAEQEKRRQITERIRTQEIILNGQKDSESI